MTDEDRPSLISAAVPKPDPLPENTPLTESGEPRRKPGRPRLSDEERERRAAERKSTATGRNSAQVNAAMTVIDSAYSMLSLGLTILGAPVAAIELSDKAAKVQDQNRMFLTANPRLAERIAKIGAGTGSFGFLVANVTVITTVAMTAQTELSAKMPKTEKPKRSKSADDGFVGEPNVSPMFPGGFPTDTGA